ncbi:uracil-DNA glycosylase family 4 [Brevundimonas faecalis]|uniref:Type-4 uracil-DNA glycosylase n=2 Tax=Brevundimonas faecalis TaxID=947378 RepID=A0ABV2REA4_9CAUL
MAAVKAYPCPRMTLQTPDIAATEALLAFWRDAGVDACYLDEPVDRTVFVAPPLSIAPSPASSGVVTPLRAPNAADAVAEARAAAAQANSMEDLAEAIAAFEGCPLKGMGARQSVFSRGDPKGALMIVGEGPGADEDIQGKPFVGKAGQLLDRILAAADLLDQAFITNTVFWRPPGNRTPTPLEQAVCAPFLDRAFVLLRPRAVLLVGAAAAKSVLKIEEGIMRTRGQWREWRSPDGDVSAPVIATLHPAFLLRQPQAKGLVWKDILDLSARLSGEKLEPPA